MHPPLGLEERLVQVERFYAERGTIPRFHVSPRAQPADLDAALAARGWSREAEVSLRIADCNPLAGLGVAEGCSARVDEQPGPDWLALALGHGRFAATPAAFLGILERIGRRAGFGLLSRAGSPVATGLAVRHGVWAGVFAMFTLPAQRGQGHGRALLGALARWAARGGARHLYLQVEGDNPEALALYEGVGFRELYGYHYRLAPGFREPALRPQTSDSAKP